MTMLYTIFFLYNWRFILWDFLQPFWRPLDPYPLAKYPSIFCIYELLNCRVHISDIILYLPLTSEHNALKVRLLGCKWQDSISHAFNSFLCECASMCLLYLYSFICQWTLWILSYIGYCNNATTNMNINQGWTTFHIIKSHETGCCWSLPWYRSPFPSVCW